MSGSEVEEIVGWACKKLPPLAAKSAAQAARKIKLKFAKNLALLASQFLAISTKLQLLSSSRADALNGPFHDLLDALEDLCEKSLDDLYARGECSSPELQKGLEQLARSNRKTVNTYLSRLQEISQKLTIAESVKDNRWLNRSKELPSEYPAHVNKALYARIYDTLTCTCFSEVSSLVNQHWAGLLLKEHHEIRTDELVGFDMIISADPLRARPGRVNWRQVGFYINSKSRRAKKVRIEAEKQDQRHDETMRQPLCELIGNDLGSSKISLKFVRDRELCRFPNELVNQWFLPEPSISLNQLLQKRSVSSRDKVALAYIIARSMWQYYDSDWLATEWSAESIHFMREPPRNRNTDGPKEGHSINPSAPYFVLQPKKQTQLLMDERSFDLDLVCRVPRIAALGILLAEICRHNTSEGGFEPGYANSVKSLNDQCSRSYFMVMTDKSWPDLDLHAKKEYSSVVEKCFAFKRFEDLPSLDSRRMMLFEEVVSPLQHMFQVIKESRHSGNIQHHASEGSGSRSASLLRDSSPTHAMSRMWVERIQTSTFIKDQSKWFSNRACTQHRIKVAVLDTGYDEGCPFFEDLVRQNRLRDWRDFTDSPSDEPVDQNGHGTQVLSVLMKVAPAANIYVARIARDRPGQTEDDDAISQNVAKAIKWAIDSGVHIITMSFGWSEVKDTVSQAILKAVVHREGNILFFAAASNSGADEPEMFPGTHGYVTSIRATDHLGHFKEFNPPSTDKNVFGTLGWNVPSAAKEGNEQDEVAFSGTSAATPIAAGIAAAILGRAAIRQKEEGDRRLSRLWQKSTMEKMLGQLSVENTHRYLSMNLVIQKGEKYTDQLMNIACA